MITYELARKLKESGFLQSLKSGSCFKFEREIPYYCDTDGFKPKEDYLKIPTLSELIEACGDGFYSLSRHANIWQTNWQNGMAGETAGKTPEETVANLWLELNKK